MHNTPLLVPPAGGVRIANVSTTWVVSVKASGNGKSPGVERVDRPACVGSGSVRHHWMGMRQRSVV